MKMIIAIIQPTKLSTVREALHDRGITRLTVCDAMGYGRQHGRMASFRGNEYRIDLLRKVALEIVVNEDFVETALQVIRETALTGSEGAIGDGKIIVIPVVDVIDIGKQTHGPSAI
ncbi:MAG: P-II family nitrogen regulator [Pirellulaceae bacterium]